MSARTPAWIARSVLALLGLFVLAQVIRPARTNPPEEPRLRLEAVVPVDATVGRVLDRACADCHSNRTVWPWYSGVAPVSWLVIHDVDEGRSTLNLSTWGAAPAPQQAKQLGEICEDVREGEMPPATYRWMHPEARLTPDDVAILCRWTESVRPGSPPPS